MKNSTMKNFFDKQLNINWKNLISINKSKKSEIKKYCVKENECCFLFI